jgi:uncharacterized membrane protein (UPF0127 family)
MLINQRTGHTLARHVIHRRSMGGQALGLMLRRGIGEDEAMVFHMRRSGVRAAGVHTLFVPFPIALIWLDETARVVDRVLAQPWRTGYRPAVPARYFVEAHPSRLELVQEGDRLQWWQE